jgi:hypothetical protein
MALTSIVALSLGNTLELSTGDLRSGTAFDTVKASFSQALKIGNLKPSTLSAEYDYAASKDFLTEASLTGDVISKGDDTVSYDITHDFGTKKTTTKVTASTKVELPLVDDVKVAAEVVNAGLEEVSAERDVDMGDQKVNVKPSWLVQAKTARVKLMTKLDGGDEITAEVDYKPDGGDTNYEVTYDHSMSDGKDLSAKISSDTGTVEVDYTDNKFEDGATWTASASVPYDAGTSNILDAAKLSLKRSWAW